MSKNVLASCLPGSPCFAGNFLLLYSAMISLTAYILKPFGLLFLNCRVRVDAAAEHWQQAQAFVPLTGPIPYRPRLLQKSS